jgi:hypothetical protein
MSELLRTASKNPKDSEERSLNIMFLTSCFKYQDNIVIFLANSSIFERSGKTRLPLITHQPVELRQLTARLYCYHGITPCEQGKEGTILQGFARSTVYDLRNYTDKTLWGPFRKDGSLSVDWEMVQAIQIILARNFRAYAVAPGDYEPKWAQPFGGVARSTLKSSYTPLVDQPDLSLEDRDPYNVSGTWIRVSSQSSRTRP